VLVTASMAALAYLLLPVTGLIAYFNSSSARVRFHGLQAITLGALWPLAIYGASSISARAGLIAWAAGALVWLGFMVPAALGLDPRIPLAGAYLRRAAEAPPGE
jgi:uncharacterized membrane protein